MSTLNQLTPIILLGLIIIIGVALTIKMGNAKYNRSKRIYWILGGYVLLLLLSVGVYLFIPVQEEEVKPDTEGVPSLYDIAYEGAPVDIASKYKVKQWEFDYENDQLSLSNRGDDQNTIPVRVDRKENDGKIEATYYQTPTFRFGMDMTKYIHPVGVSMEADNLFVDLPDSTRLEFNGYKKEFPMKQFTEEGFWESDNWMEYGDRIYGEQFLYLRVPKNIKINANGDMNFTLEGVEE